MANIDQYSFPIDEVASLLIKQAGITEGFWSIVVNFNIGVAAAGPDKDHIRPTAMVSVDQLGLIRAKEMGPLTYDAAKLSEKAQ